MQSGLDFKMRLSRPESSTRSAQETVALHRKHPITELQQTAGNHAVQQLLRDNSASGEQSHADRAAKTGTAGKDSASTAPGESLGAGHGLDAGARTLLGEHPGADFGNVRIHDDAAAAKSAKSVGALAYTVGNHIVFGTDQFDLQSTAGRALLAHKMAHTIQQARDGRPRMQRKPDPSSTVDVDVVPESKAEVDQLKGTGVNLPTVSNSTWNATGGSPYTTLLPGYSQQGDTCGAASLVSALLIWDREHWDPGHPNSRIEDACNLILIELERHGSEAAERWATAHPVPVCAGDHACDVAQWKSMRDTFISTLQNIRDTARVAGGKVEESDYQQLGLSLYFLWNQGHGSGLGTPEIERIQRSLGLYSGVSGNLTSFDAIFTNAIVSGLAPDEIAQVFWFVRPSGQQHAFLVGRLSSGKWFLSDQGPKPAVEFQADSLDELHHVVRTAATIGTYWLFAGTIDEYMAKSHLLPGWTGVMKLGSAGSTKTAVQQAVPLGAELGEVDAGLLTFGSTITCGGFISQQYTLSDAESALPPGPGGGLIVEQPAGVFSTYATSAVSQANLDQTSLDADDSAHMLLGGTHTFHRAFLILGTSIGLRRGWFQVY
jgi:hypothetical protein